VKKIIIKSSVLLVLLCATIVGSSSARAGVFAQLAAVANSALPTYGRAMSHTVHHGLRAEQIEAGIREVIIVAGDRVATAFEATYTDSEIRLSSDMRRARRKAVKLGHEESFKQLQHQINAAVIAAVPATNELLKAAMERVEIKAPHRLLVSHDTAATDYLRSRVSLRLHRQLEPFLAILLEDSGASSTIATLGPRIKFGSLLDTIVAEHVMQQSIDGFFDRLEVEESKIRQNPESRTTDLLKQVFG